MIYLHFGYAVTIVALALVLIAIKKDIDEDIKRGGFTK